MVDFTPYLRKLKIQSGCPEGLVFNDTMVLYNRYSTTAEPVCGVEIYQCARLEVFGQSELQHTKLYKILYKIL